MARPPGHGPSYEVKRQEIIDLAAGLFAKNGYAATGIVEIGEAVGLAKGALYYYIKSKENLLVEIQERVLDPLVNIGNQITDVDTSPAVKLRLLSHALLDMIFKRLDHIWVYEHDYKHLTGENLTQMLKRRHEFEGIVRNILISAMNEGIFLKTDPDLCMLQFLNMHNHTYQWLKTDGRWDAEALSKAYCRTLFTGFAGGAFDFISLETEVSRIQTLGGY
ncbi:TetR/AcrR family transcriptional regulator [Rhodococcus sp. 14-2470-1a]|uniref:TetR/AcrR family transcriptional regulator n=1 Tax=Rhodococcus sp. 14-2470-1a TaxID=2023150 RepID=UPI000B9AF0CB|nr:TetR/AcrR family transcriptional regulator [Rhodococcus sp. 14-2470-1a]OZF45760.1 TetR family transcriptional regulator [Rhodococcus sp. 14-2470-1a]